MKEPLFSRVLRYALYITFVVGLAGSMSLPFTIDEFFRLFRGTYLLVPAYRAFILPFLMTLAVPCLWVVMEMILMLHSISNGPFVKRNVTALYRVGVVLLVMSVMFFVSMIWHRSIIVFAGGFFAVGAGLFSFTFAELIRQAILFREENELTI